MRLLFFVAILFWGGCANTMGTYYGAISTAATVTTVGVGLLDQYDADTQAKIKTQAATDPKGAQAALNAYLPRYTKAQKALADTVAAIQIASAAAPTIEAAANKSTQIAGWISKLYALGAEAVADLAAAGVKLPAAIGGGK